MPTGWSRLVTIQACSAGNDPYCPGHVWVSCGLVTARNDSILFTNLMLWDLLCSGPLSSWGCTISVGGKCFSFFLRHCGYAFALLFGLFAKLGGNLESMQRAGQCNNSMFGPRGSVHGRDLLFTLEWGGGAVGASLRGEWGMQGCPKGMQTSPNSCKRYSCSFAMFAKHLCKGRSTVMQKSSETHAKVAQQLCKARPKVTPRSPNSCAKVARNLWGSRQTLMRRSSNSFANVAKQFCKGRPIVMEMSPTSCKGQPTSTGVTYIHR